MKDAARVAVCVAADGIGPWKDEEMRAALTLAVRDRRPVIPVLLPGAPGRPELPLFLVNRTWVDLRAGFADEALRNLVWGITGQRPAGGATGETTGGPPPIPSKTLFIDEVIELLYHYSTLILLVQADRDLGPALEVLRRRAQERYGSGWVLYLAPPRDPRASEAEFFAALGGRARMVPVPQPPSPPRPSSLYLRPSSPPGSGCSSWSVVETPAPTAGASASPTACQAARGSTGGPRAWCRYATRGWSAPPVPGDNCSCRARFGEGLH